MNIEVDSDLCIGSGECVLIAPALFALDNGDDTARIRGSGVQVAPETVDDAIAACPTGAIRRSD